jgi:pilus assembly protein CpaB
MNPANRSGFIQPGSKVAVFTCVSSRKGQKTKVYSTITGELCTGVRLLLKDVEVIGVGATTLLSTTTTDQSGVQTTEEIPRTILTLGVDQEDAEKLIFAKRNGELTLGLMTDESDVDPTIGVYPDTVFE